MNNRQRQPLVNGEFYHVMNKSIEGYKIFPQQKDYDRLLTLFHFFSMKEAPTKFSYFLEHDPLIEETGIHNRITELTTNNTHTKIIAYCLMPTHFHLLLQQVETRGISEMLRKSSNAYARYFNTKYKRKGTLWMSRFKSVLVENDEQLLHLTRYIHLNPVTAGLVGKAENWSYSSYKEFTNRNQAEHQITTQIHDTINMSPKDYAKFVNDHTGFQRELAIIKKQALE